MSKTIKIISALHTANLQDKRVFLRADLNVPLKNGLLQDDHRLEALLPTIDLIQRKGGKIILATHIGRPKKRETHFSTQLLVPWFEKRGYTVDFEPDLDSAHKKSFRQIDRILLLDNIRFFSEEKTSSAAFSQRLAQLGDYYVNDAFGLLHRTDNSIIEVPKLFSRDNRTIGLLIEQELNMLNKLLEKIERPFVLILGGGKISGKLPILKAFVQKVDTVLLCPAIVFTFLKAQNKPVGKSLVDDSHLSTSKEILKKAATRGCTLLFPLDYQTALEHFGGPLSFTNSPAIAHNAVGVSIGPKTETLFAREIAQAKTIFFNGAIGDVGRKETLVGMKSILVAMAESKAFTIVGGGDSVAVARQFNLASRMGYCSTGGGATLAYLSGEKLPGLAAFV